MDSANASTDAAWDAIPQAVAFLRALFGQAPHDHYLEIRPLGRRRGGGSKDRKFFRLRQLQRRGFDQAVPCHLNGKVQVYVGVLPRSQQGGTAEDVTVATCLWADLDKGWPAIWPATLPAPSIVVESSPGKFQPYWLLTEPTSEVTRVSELVRRLAQTLGGDNVADPPRILRLPGFANLKYPERPVAQLREAHPERRFTLAELEAALPPLVGKDKAQGTGQANARQPHGDNQGRFDPHAGGGDVPQAMLAELRLGLLSLGASWYHDGRLVAACPFLHVDGPCACTEGFYFSPISGRWWCFCSDHPQRDPAKVCVGGGAWSLWPVLFPGRPRPQREEPANGQTSTSSPRKGRVGDADNSRRNPYEPPAPAALEALRHAPKHGRTAALLRLVGQREKAQAEANCGMPVKGKCPKPKHGVVRALRASGKTPWCAGCNTETSAKYLHIAFPEAAYSILRLQRHLGPVHYDAAELEPGVWEMDAADSARISAQIGGECQNAVGHFRRIQRRFGHQCLGWHLAVGQDQEGLWVELQVLVRHDDQLQQVLRELTGDTRKAALFSADTVIRSDYPAQQLEQLRRDWASLLKCALLRLEDDALFIPIYAVLDKRQLSQTYGDLRAAYAQVVKEKRNGQGEDITLCPVVQEDGKVCGCKLSFFLDPLDKHPLNYEVLRGTPAGAHHGGGDP